MDSKNNIGTKRKIDPLPHHKRQKLCRTRLPYRKGKKQTAVKVFTIADESFYLLIQNVPILSGVDVEYDLKLLCYKYGQFDKFEQIQYDNEELFTKTYLIKYTNFIDAIKAKKILDDKEFLGSILHVCYCPEQETYEETLEKLNCRQRYINVKMAQMENLISQKNDNNNKKKKVNKS